jgi:hypothetical protein
MLTSVGKLETDERYVIKKYRATPALPLSPRSMSRPLSLSPRATPDASVCRLRPSRCVTPAASVRRWEVLPTPI